MKQIKFRRLTRLEAKRLGVSYTAKRRVDASLKRITKSTKLYTDRQVAEARLGVKREARTKERIKEYIFKKGDGASTHYADLSRSDLSRVLNRLSPETVVLMGVHGVKAGSMSGIIETDKAWSTLPKMRAIELTKPGGFEHIMRRFRITNPDRYQIIVYRKV
jgi:hypothetical protein